MNARVRAAAAVPPAERAARNPRCGFSRRAVERVRGKTGMLLSSFSGSRQRPQLTEGSAGVDARSPGRKEGRAFPDASPARFSIRNYLMRSDSGAQPQSGRQSAGAPLSRSAGAASAAYDCASCASGASLDSTDVSDSEEESPARRERRTAETPPARGVRPQELYRASNSVFVSEEKGVYAPSLDAINIEELHSIVQEMCAKPKDDDIQDLRDEIADVNEQLTSPMSVTEFRALCRKQERLKEELELKESNSRLQNFIRRSSRIVERYSTITKRQKPSIFGKKRERTHDDSVKDSLRTEYLSVLEKDLIPVYVDCDDDEERLCPLCDGPLEESPEHEGHIICACGYIEPMMKIEFSKSKSGRRADRNKGGCMKTVRLIQGHQSYRFDIDLVMQKLDEYFLLTGTPTCDEMKHNALLDSGVREGTSRTKMRSALFAMGMGSLQAYINLIAREYWGWRLPDFTDVQSRVCADVKSFYDVYSSFNEGRDTNINPFWLVHRVLEERYDRRYDVEFFKIIKTEETRNQYKRIYDACARHLGWK